MLNEIKRIIILADYAFRPERMIMLLDQHFQVQQLRVAIFI